LLLVQISLVSKSHRVEISRLRSRYLLVSAYQLGLPLPENRTRHLCFQPGVLYSMALPLHAGLERIGIIQPFVSRQFDLAPRVTQVRVGE
jgi:hypothetical protein